MGQCEGMTNPCEPRAQFLGTLKFMCPFCGNVAQYRIALGQWKIQCVNDECHRQMVIGIRVLIPDRVRTAADVGRTPSDYTFPVAELGHWRPGGPAHVLVESGD